ncbi:MAG: SpoIIE family protein phosphatase [Acidimicrobiales bacterium]
MLLVEDDAGDTLLVCEQLAEAAPEFEVVPVQTLSAAEQALTSTIACVLFDLGLPDAEGLEGLRSIISMAPGTAVVVLTGLVDQSKGPDAVALGAEDYLVKGHVDGEGLGRSLRYAIARRRGEEALRRLSEAEFLRSENTRLERGLLPRPLITTSRLKWATRYQPGGGRALLGGDFFDGIELPDGTVRVVVGDVCGHGPDEAALGVAMRVAWRALVIGGVDPDAIMPALERLLETERFDDQTFVTLCDLTLRPELRHAQVRLAGHPAPLHLDGSSAKDVPAPHRGPPLGVVENGSWESHEIELGSAWTLLLFTDGIIEGRTGPGRERLGDDGLTDLLVRLVPDASKLGLVAERLVHEVEGANGEPLGDDIALFLLSNDEHWSE